MTDAFRAAGFPSTSKSSVCWDPLQTLGVQGEQSESFLHYSADSLREVHSAVGAERSHSFPNPDSDHVLACLLHLVPLFVGILSHVSSTACFFQSCRTHYAREGRGFYLPDQSYLHVQRAIGVVSPFPGLRATSHT